METRRESYNRIMKALNDWNRKEAEALYIVARRHGAKDAEIAKEIGVYRTAVNRKYGHLLK